MSSPVPPESLLLVPSPVRVSSPLPPVSDSTSVPIRSRSPGAPSSVRPSRSAVTSARVAAYVTVSRPVPPSSTSGPPPTRTSLPPRPQQHQHAVPEHVGMRGASDGAAWWPRRPGRRAPPASASGTVSAARAGKAAWRDTFIRVVLLLWSSRPGRCRALSMGTGQPWVLKPAIPCGVRHVHACHAPRGLPRFRRGSQSPDGAPASNSSLHSPLGGSA